MKSFSFFIFPLLFCFSSIAQQTTLTGAIVLEKTEFMSYKITYQLNNTNVLAGYSVCDINGNEETKARITGFFNPKKKTLNFEEISIISTRSKTPVDEFCLMKVSGKFEKKAGKFVYTGKFDSKCRNPNITCDSGTIVLMTEKNLEALAAKATKALEKVPQPDNLNKEAIEEPAPETWVRKVIELAPETVTDFDLESDYIQLDLVDDKYQDGDKVTVMENDTKVLSGFEITNRVKSLRFKSNKEDKAVTLTIIADDEGSIPPATVKAVLRNGNESNVIKASLKKGQSVKMTFKKK